MKRITIDVEDSFDATADELRDMLVSAQIGLVYGIQIDVLPDSDLFDTNYE